MQLYSLKMNVSQIREKYKQILDDSDDSDDEIEHKSYKSKVPLGKTRVFTQQNENLSQSVLTDCQPSSKIVVSLKQRIAQGIKNLSKKDDEIVALKQQIIRMQGKNKLLEDQLKNMKKIIEKQEDKLIDEKVRSGTFQAEIKRLKQVIQASHIDKQLIYKQAQFYKREINGHKYEKNGLNKKMEVMQKDIKEFQKLKNMNNRLKDDLKRMHIILNELSQKKDGKKLVDKHYLGKPYKEHHHWFPQNLIGEVQLFLKRQQVGQGNKDFVNNLVKFIDRYHRQVKKEKKIHSNHLQREERSRMYASSFCQKSSSIPRTQFLGKSSLKQNIVLSRYTKNGSKKYTQSLLYTQGPTFQVKCEQILSQFYKIMSQALQQRQIKKKRILKLTQQMSKSILSLFDEQNCIKNYEQL